MQTAGGEADQRVAGLYASAEERVVALDGADGEAGEVVIALPVQARHFRRFAADEGASGDLAAPCDAGDDVARMRRIEPGGGEIVEKHQGLGARDDQVVDAHRD